MTDNSHYDVIIVWLVVHGGSYHKAIHLHEMMIKAGLRSKVVLNRDPPMGLQVRLDVSEEQMRQLAKSDVHILSMQELEEVVDSTPARLFLFDSFEEPKTGRLVSLVKRRHDAKTGQLGALFDDFCYWDTDYVFLQHPITLWFILKQRRKDDAKRLVSAKKIFFAGNILYEPICNTWTSDVASREQLFSKYSFDESLPLCLWLPNRLDGRETIYGQVLETIQSIPMNVAVKLHPWEYKNLEHGFDPRYGEGVTSADRWGASAIEERDSTWALRFCDVAIASGSSIGIEMPSWRKPLIYVCDSTWRGEVVKSCSVRIDDIGRLKDILVDDYPLEFSDEDYQRAREVVFPKSPLDSFQLHLRCIQEILALPSRQPPIGKIHRIRSLYRGAAPRSWRGSPIRSTKGQIAANVAAFVRLVRRQYTQGR